MTGKETDFLIGTLTPPKLPVYLRNFLDAKINTKGNTPIFN
jgi:hypothetical protein